MTTKHLFRDLQEAVETARGLQGRRSAHHGENRQNDVDRGLTGLEVETEDKDDEAHAADQAEPHTALAGTVEQRGENHQQLNPKVKTESHV